MEQVNWGQVHDKHATAIHSVVVFQLWEQSQKCGSLPPKPMIQILIWGSRENMKSGEERQRPGYDSQRMDF